MAALNVILLVLFVIACLLIVFLVLLQNEEGDSIGGLFAGGSNSAFGSNSGNVLTKATYILVTIFFVSSFLLAVLNKTSYGSSTGVQEEGQKIQNEGAEPWYDTEKKDGESSIDVPQKTDAPSATDESSNSNDTMEEHTEESMNEATTPAN
ncbi:MAG: preprotein translocase subunit SecG [Treponema sp.]